MNRIIEALKRIFKRREVIQVIITKEQLKKAFESEEDFERLINNIEYRMFQERVAIDILELNEEGE